MSYSNETFRKAKDRLDERRAQAVRAADYRREQLYAAEPRLKQIDRELSEIGASLAFAVLKTGNTAVNVQQLADRSIALQREYTDILHKLGENADATEPHYTCQKCRDTGYVEENNRTLVCDCLKKLLADVACESLNAESPLELSTFDSFRLDLYSDRPDHNGTTPLSRMSNIYNYCRHYADTFSLASRSVLMRGATGLGKTHLSLAIANEVIRKGMSVVYVSAPDILSRLEREHFTYQYAKEEDTFSSLVKCDLLILDDLGTEFVSQFSVAAVYNLFNSRILAGRPIIMNTNLTLNELLTTYSQRFMSRVLGACDRLEFIGEDIRPRI